MQTGCSATTITTIASASAIASAPPVASNAAEERVASKHVMSKPFVSGASGSGRRGGHWLEPRPLGKLLTLLLSLTAIGRRGATRGGWSGSWLLRA